MERRQFLDPRSWSTPPPADPAPIDAALLRLGRRAMATTFEVLFPLAGNPEAAERALDLIDRVEDQLTVYRDHSELSQLNRAAGLQPTSVTDDLFDLLYLCKQLWEATGGAFDVSVGALIKAWGFYRRQGRVPSEEERAQVRQRIGMNHVRFDDESKTVAFDVPGLEVNLGSIGKGYALDRVVTLLWRDWDVRHALVHGGHSSVFAVGSEPGSSRGWRVSLADPRSPGKKLGTLRLHNRGLGTSSAAFQFLEHEGRRLGHLLDPRTCWPAEGMLSASVTAPSASVADALATAFFIVGADSARAYCEQHPEIGAVLLPSGPRGKVTVLGQAQHEFN